MKCTQSFVNLDLDYCGEVNPLTFTSGFYAGQRSLKKQSDDRLLAPFAQVRDKRKTNQQIIELEI